MRNRKSMTIKSIKMRHHNTLRNLKSACYVCGAKSVSLLEECLKYLVGLIVDLFVLLYCIELRLKIRYLRFQNRILLLKQSHLLTKLIKLRSKPSVLRKPR